jgi:glutaconyl-CoA decarboxylase
VKRRFRITVEGKSWEVEVEELPAGAAGEVWPGPAAAPGRTTPLASVGGEIRAPAPGKILRVAVKPGDRVEPHDLLLVIETMKIESRIEAPVAGQVEAVHVSAGDTVQTGSLLLSLA